MSALAHWAIKKSWWNGDVTTACGLVLPKAERSEWLAEKCPTCLAAKKRK